MNLGNQSVVDFAKEAQKLGFSIETRVVAVVVYELKDGVHGLVFREWAENATALSLVGDFNNWSNEANPAVPMTNHVFEVWLPDKDGKCCIPHLSKVKVLHSSSIEGKSAAEVPRRCASLSRTVAHPLRHSGSDKQGHVCRYLLGL